MSTILAIETSAKIFSLALYQQDKIVNYRMVEEEQKQEQMLAPMVQEMLNENGTIPSELSAIAVGSGPGSYTGLRIGMAFASGFSFASGLPIIPVGTLENIAFQLFENKPDSNIALAVLPARKDEYFIAAWLNGEDAPLIVPACYPVIELAALFIRLSAAGSLTTNSDDSALLASLAGIPVQIQEKIRAGAREVAFLADRKLKAGFLMNGDFAEPEYLKPVYITSSKGG
jgi:tRNA threonylcarbamoyladenosine biosynthesis protein TsaB